MCDYIIESGAILETFGRLFVEFQDGKTTKVNIGIKNRTIACAVLWHEIVYRSFKFDRISGVSEN